MNYMLRHLYTLSVDRICALNWSELTESESIDLAWAYYYFSIQFRENLAIARRLYPDDEKLVELEAGECMTDNLSPWPGVAEPAVAWSCAPVTATWIVLEMLPDVTTTSMVRLDLSLPMPRTPVTTPAGADDVVPADVPPVDVVALLAVTMPLRSGVMLTATPPTALREESTAVTVMVALSVPVSLMVDLSTVTTRSDAVGVGVVELDLVGPPPALHAPSNAVTANAAAVVFKFVVLP